jgi:hypothetical protein
VFSAGDHFAEAAFAVKNDQLVRRGQRGGMSMRAGHQDSIWRIAVKPVWEKNRLIA